MLTLICPGLLGPVPVTAESLPKTPSVDRLLARAQRMPSASRDPSRLLLHASGLSMDPERDAPTAAISLLGESCDEQPQDYWLHADPVHLRADRDRLLLFSSAGIAPDREEANALVALFNSHFEADGLRLIAPDPARWYLRSDRPLDLRTEPLDGVIGGPIPADSPSGLDARCWAGLMNEIQMLFYTSAVNTRREQQRRPAISGIWTWGGGVLPDRPADIPEVLIGDDPLTCGLARWAGVAHRTLAQWQADRALPEVRSLVLWDHLRSALREQDLAAWLAGLTTLEARLAELETAIRQGRLDALLIEPCEGMVYRVTRSALRRFWRRGGLAGQLVDPSTRT